MPIETVKEISNATKLSKAQEAFANLEKLRKKGDITDDKAELASYREEKYDDDKS